MIGRRRHLHEDRLVERYVAECSGDSGDPQVADHLDACPACQARYADLARFMDDLRSEADVDVDEQFPEARLQAARRQIARRIENLGHVARVISFPGLRTDGHRDGSQTHRGSRWVAAAAAAGLFIGLALGAYTGMGADGQANQVVSSRPAAAPEVATPVRDTDTGRPILDEDAFLQELENARGGLRARPLMPFDAFTPTVREVTAQLR